jgi:hypothetical protein
MPKVRGIYKIIVDEWNLVNDYEVVGISWNQTAVDIPVTIKSTPTPKPWVTPE